MSPKRKKILVALLTCGLLAVLVDWLLLGGGFAADETGSGDNATPTPTVADADPSPSDDDPEDSLDDFEIQKLISRFDVQPASVTFDDRLHQLARQSDMQSGELRDAFAVHHAWFAPDQPDEPASEEQPEQQPDELERRAQQFRSSHQLQAVLPGRADGMAVVSGRTLRIGDSLDGFTLVRTAPRAVTFQAGDHEIHLRLAVP